MKILLYVANAIAILFAPAIALADPLGAPDYSAKPRQEARVAPGHPQAGASPGICAEVGAHIRFLKARYGEFPVFSGLAAPGIRFRLFANMTTGSWTMLMVRNNGFSCVRGAGQKFRHEVGT